jgi:hypothetical protein
VADGGIWAALGVAPTGDERAIRIAYMQRLKAINVDTDAAGFIALRSAHDAAMAGARGERGGENWLDAMPQAPASAEEQERKAETDGTPRDIHSPVAELHQLFETVAQDGRRWLSADEKLVLRRCWAAIAADADGGNIERYGAAEQAARELILGWGSLAVGLVPFAVEYFHWDAHEGGIAGDGTIAEIMWRYRAIQFLQRVRRPGHSHHAAWVELKSRYFPGSSRGRCDPLVVHELQAVVRHVWPEVETEFDPGRVALWANNTADPAHPENPDAPPPARVLRIVKIIGAIYLFVVIIGVLRGLLDAAAGH